MIHKKLKSRLKFVEATPLKNRAQASIFSRRDNNFVIMDEEGDAREEYDTFFDYEEELADLKPSGEQYVEAINQDPFIILEEKEGLIKETFEPTIMEELPEPEEIKNIDSSEMLVSNDKNSPIDVVGFEFIQCDFIKKDGIRCKKQAPKGHSICSTHRKYMEKHNS